MDLAFTEFRAFDAGDSTRRLRPLDWPALRARLAAAHELRCAIDASPLAGAGLRTDAMGTGSFHGPAAQLLRAQAKEDGEGTINPTSSANGKADASTTHGTHARLSVRPNLRNDSTRRVMP